MGEIKPLCFVLMPFGKKPDATGGPPIDFDRVYVEAIEPAIAAAGLIAIRADEEKVGGIIHKPMFERLLLCEYAIADLTTANANVFYELGVRHAARPRSTLAIYARRQPRPFDVNLLRTISYDLGPQGDFPDENAESLRETLTQKLQALRDSAGSHAVDSPLFQLLDGWKPAPIARETVDAFREHVDHGEAMKSRMRRACQAEETGKAELDAVRRELGQLDIEEAGLIVQLLLSYRDISAWSRMIELYEAMPEVLKRQVQVRQQVALALNRHAGAKEKEGENGEEDRTRALEMLEAIEAEHGPSSETWGIIGRIHKDRWEKARKGNPHGARGHLGKAIKAYRTGFYTDWRDAYPGINALTLLDIQGSADSLAERDWLLPVVRFAAEQKIAGKSPDYWDHATMLELAVLRSDRDAADRHLGDALSADPKAWMRKSTTGNLGYIRDARAERGEDVGWLSTIIEAFGTVA